MSLYHILFLWLVLGAVIEYRKRKTPRYLFWVTFAVLTVFLCIRFGQGQDYFNYARIYRSIGRNLLLAPSDSHRAEPGFNLLCGVFRMVNAPYPVFVFVISLYMMAMFFRFLGKFCGKRKMLALVLSYHTLYLTYFMSILRQGIVIATLLGILLPLLLKRDYLKYCLISAVLVFFHTVALALFLLPVVQNIKLSSRQCTLGVLLGLVLGIVLSIINIGLLLKSFLPLAYLDYSDVSFFSLAERLITFAAVSYCFYSYPRDKKRKHLLVPLYKIYCAGVFLYCILMWSPLIASRTAYLFKVTEIALLCLCVPKVKRGRSLVLLFCLALSGLMYVKNIASYLDQGKYENAGIWDYPYVTVFNQEQILHYRSDTKKYPFP